MSLSALQKLLPIECTSPSPTPTIKLTPQQTSAFADEFHTYETRINQHAQKLAPVAVFLDSFSRELGELSSNLVALQKRSKELSSTADSDKTITDRLNPVILDLAVPPEVISSLVSGEITPEWTENLAFINEKKEFIQSTEEGKLWYKDTRAFEDLKKTVELLQFKAVERIRHYMVYQIKQLRSNKVSQNVQQTLLSVKEIFPFLWKHHEKVAYQLRLAYIFTMHWYYKTRFAKYLYSLQKLNIKHVDANVVLGNEEKGMAGPSQNECLQSLDKRLEILNEATVIPSQIAETTPFAYWLEFVYNQWAVAVVDNIVVEYLFVVDFFYDGSEKFGENPWHETMFEGVIDLGKEFVGHLLSHVPAKRIGPSCDAFAVLLIIRLIQKQQSRLHNELHIAVLDEYLNSLLMVLWPHFTKIIDLNCESLRSVSLRAGKESNLAPVSVTQQFGQFLSGLLKLGTEDYKGEPLYFTISRLRSDFETVLTKLSTHYFGRGSKMEKEVFLYNNYFLIVSILKNENEEGGLVTEQIEHFEGLCRAYKQ